MHPHQHPRPPAPSAFRLLVALLCLCGALFADPTWVGAQDAPAPAGAPAPGEGPAGAEDLTWSVRPTPVEGEETRPNFSFEVAAGGTLRDSFRVRNFGVEVLPLRIYATDAVITPEGQMSLLPAEEEPTGAGSWVTLESDTLLVPPGAFVDVPFTVEVPENAESGDHSGGIVTSFVAESAEDGRPVLLDRRLGSRMHIRVSGDLRPALEIRDVVVEHEGRLNPVAPGSVEVRYTVENTGNVRLAADQLIRVAGWSGIGGQELTLDPMPELLVGSSLSFTVPVADVWPAFVADVDIELTPIPVREGDGFQVGPTVASASVRTVPWPQLAVVAAAVLGPVVLWRRSRRRSRKETVRVQAAVEAALAARDQEAGAAEAPVPTP